MPLVEVKENFVGCVLEIRWCCKAGHVGDWQSSKAVQQVYVNNIQAASARLFTGNNFVKLSLFAKCFQLAFFCSSTFHKYQKKVSCCSNSFLVECYADKNVCKSWRSDRYCIW